MRTHTFSCFYYQELVRLALVPGNTLKPIRNRLAQQTVELHSNSLEGTRRLPPTRHGHISLDYCGMCSHHSLIDVIDVVYVTANGSTDNTVGLTLPRMGRIIASGVRAVMTLVTSPRLTALWGFYSIVKCDVINRENCKASLM